MRKSKFGSTRGTTKKYPETGYVLRGDTLKEKLKTFKTIDLKQAVIDLELEAVILHGLYYIPSYRSWISRAMVFEFPRDNDIKTRARVDPIKLKNRDDPEVKMRFSLDIVNILL